MNSEIIINECKLCEKKENKNKFIADAGHYEYQIGEKIKNYEVFI